MRLWRGELTVWPVRRADDYQLGSDIFCLTTCDGFTGYCGDNVINGPEECDDADTDDTDACPSNCLDATCGDGFVFSLGREVECDDGRQSNADACLTTCEAASCGDDANQNSPRRLLKPATMAIRCNHVCLLVSWLVHGLQRHLFVGGDGEVSYCGDSVLDADAGEVCDDGDTSSACETDALIRVKMRMNAMMVQMTAATMPFVPTK